MPTTIKLEKLKLGFGESTVITDASLTLDAGDFACIVGANGAGKSTLVKAILGLIKPQSGNIYYLNGLAQTQIGYLPQETRVDNNFPAQRNVSSIYLVARNKKFSWLARFPLRLKC